MANAALIPKAVKEKMVIQMAKDYNKRLKFLSSRQASEYEEKPNLDKTEV